MEIPYYLELSNSAVALYLRRHLLLSQALHFLFSTLFFAFLFLDIEIQRRGRRSYEVMHLLVTEQIWMA